MIPTVGVDFGYQKDTFEYATDVYDCGIRVNLERPIKTSSMAGSAESAPRYPSDTTTCSICSVSNVIRLSAAKC